MNKYMLGLLSVAVFVTLSMYGPMVSANETDTADAKKQKDDYVLMVVSALRAHVKALHHLTAHDIKYSDNVARHAIGIKNTFDMLGPMDWHAAEAKRLQKEMKNNDSAILTEKEFEKLAEYSYDRINRLRQSAHRWMRDNNRDAFMKDLDGMMQSCKKCHSLLPKNTAPSVWKGLKGKW